MPMKETADHALELGGSCGAVGLLGLWQRLGVSGFRLILARGWHETLLVLLIPCLQNPLNVSRTVRGLGLSASAGPVRSGEIRARWCQLWVSPGLALCLQNTLRLSGTVAHLGRSLQSIRLDRHLSGPVVVSIGGHHESLIVCLESSCS
jgi:hypothetical protein